MRKIKNLAILGDFHFNYKSPISRIDDYPNTCLEKLDTLLEICINRDYKDIVVLGDFFNKPSQPIEYLYKVITKLDNFKKNNINVYSIYGNHDLIFDKLDRAPKTSLGLLFKTGFIKELQKEQLQSISGYTINLYGYHYPQIITPVRALENTGDVNICCCHRYYNYSYSNTSLTKNNIIDLDYDIYCTGHEHQPYELTKVNNKLVIRPGRFMRGSSDNYNIEDTSVYMDVIQFMGTKEKPSIQVIREVIPTKSPNEIFSTKALTKDNSDKVLSSLSEKVTSLLDKMDFKGSTNNLDVYQILDELEVDSKIKNRIETYLQAEGINRSKIDL